MMATETTKGEIDDVSRDLLRRFAGKIGSNEPSFVGVGVGVGGDMSEVELSLGLSLNGCFGVEPKDKGRLIRSSSVATLSMFPVERSEFPLMRTCSLPTEIEDERRKRKEMQSLKRLEAMRKRSEKQRAARENLEEVNKVLNGPPPKWAVVGPGGRPVSQGSIGSQGSSSSGVSDFDSRPMQDVRSPSTRSPLSDQNLVAMKPRNREREEEDEVSKKRSCTRTSNGVREMERNMMEEMPCVSTRGDGPNGRRIEGFLYKYRKGEEVRIVCVCHGSFLTPAEFVKHAGGGDVDHPLRHIVVNPAPTAFL